MMEEVKKGGIYKSILGDAQSSIEAIQRFLKENSNGNISKYDEEKIPAESINRVLDSIVDEETNSDIQRIIDNL